MATRRRDRASEDEPAKSNNGRTGADPEEANQTTLPSGVFIFLLLSLPPPTHIRKGSEHSARSRPSRQPMKFREKRRRSRQEEIGIAFDPLCIQRLVASFIFKNCQVRNL
ncbi:hypothetical protein T07_3935 [Trichinella nelsoni]|uniref:Uncharacterized protein n=1 Tax=Trichinella nelsoni TaxID=6336 RepID=A0A0V0S9G1_9BILA|nr:hypothetical protein T07_3935 [Trichinella nelsoni]